MAWFVICRSLNGLVVFPPRSLLVNNSVDCHRDDKLIVMLR